MGKEGGKTRPPTTLTFHFLSINIPGVRGLAPGDWPRSPPQDHFPIRNLNSVLPQIIHPKQ